MSKPGLSAVPISHIHTYLVHPAKGNPNPQPIGGSGVALSGKMYDLLQGVYDRSEKECNIAISFNMNSSGAQQNDCRDLVTDYLNGPNLKKGRQIAKRLADHTDNRSRLGLLFLIAGQEGLDRKIIISRFPADSGILAEQAGGALNVEFLERIFMKSAKSYKAAVYRHSSLSSGFWKGHAIDKQMDDQEINLSGYWITDFLDSDFVTTAESGTRRLAIACRNATRQTSDLSVKQEIVSAVILAKNQEGKHLSARDFLDRAGLSPSAKEAVLSEMGPRVVDQKFKFSSEEFGNQITYRSIELDNGAILTAETHEFDKIFESKTIDQLKSKARYTTEGRVVREKIGKFVR